ncbi:MAG: STAS domain-containing protein [Pseudooceanicola sp.]
MKLTARVEDETCAITVDETRIDAAAAIRFKDRMREVIPQDARRIVLDLGAVTFIDSSGLGAIVSVMKQLDDGQRLELAALQPNVDRVFRLTRMDTVFPIHSCIAEAVRNHAD